MRTMFGSVIYRLSQDGTCALRASPGGHSGGGIDTCLEQLLPAPSQALSLGANFRQIRRAWPPGLRRRTPEARQIGTFGTNEMRQGRVDLTVGALCAEQQRSW